MKNGKKIRIATLSLSAALLLGACSSPSETNEESMTDPTPETEIPAESEEIAEAETARGIENAVINLELMEAIDLFHGSFDNADIHIDSIEFECDNGRYVYEIEGWDSSFEYDMTIDAESAEIIEQEKEEDSDEEDILDLDAIISPTDAIDAALNASGSGYADEWELEYENGRMIYEVDISDGSDQKIDAISGEVL